MRARERVCLVLVAGFLIGSAWPTAAQTTRALIRDDDAPNLLNDGAWRPYGSLQSLVRRGDAFICDNGGDAKARNGVMEVITLNQKVPLPIVASAWSKAVDVDGDQNADYSLYLDLAYVDGEPLHGQIAPFRTGSHGWQRVEVKVAPAKPVRSVAFHMLLRSHAGKALFRQPRLFQLEPHGNAALFDGYAVKLGGRAGRFRVRDVAAGSDFESIDGGLALGLRLDVAQDRRGDATLWSGHLSDTTGKDRAVTLIATVPAGGGGWQWLVSPRQAVPASAPGEYVTASSDTRAGSGRLSLYPLAAVSRSDEGRAIGIDMSRPAFFRVGYSAGTGELYVAYDLGLTSEKPSADVQFCSFPFAGAWGFRAAVAEYYRIFPEQFRCRTPKQGLWMPFDAISKVEGWEDFGFRFKEGDNETAWDDAHDILTFRYTEPMTWWMPMAKPLPRNLDAALAEARRLAAEGNTAAQALLTSGMWDEAGAYVARFLNEPWCDGAVWSLNSSPAVRGDVTDFKNKWNAALKDNLYGEARKGDLDGEYVDSGEGYVTAELDFRREHFATAATPLTFSQDDFRPGIFRGLIAQEYVRAISDDVHAMGKLIMANGTPTQLCWLAPLLDVMGTETDWNHDGRWRPMRDGELLYRRALCGTKPYCFLMNTRFDRFTHELVEKYMKRCLAYGMFPGFFSENASEGRYFNQPMLYNRDRDLFKKYVPLCRVVAEAGWQPVTRARSSEAKVYVERFGDRYLTVFNDSGGDRAVAVAIEGKAPAKVRELLTQVDLAVTNGVFRLALKPEDVAVVELE